MGYRYNAFGYQTLNVDGRSHFTTISGNGKIETTWAMPTYDPETKLWNVETDFYVDGSYSQGDIAWDGHIPLELLPKDFDPSIAIYRTLFSNDVLTEENWKEKIISTVEERNAIFLEAWTHELKVQEERINGSDYPEEYRLSALCFHAIENYRLAVFRKKGIIIGLREGTKEEFELNRGLDLESYYLTRIGSEYVYFEKENAA